MAAALDRYHYVLWLEISVDYLLVVQVLQGQNCLGDVKACVLLYNRIIVHNLAQEVAALDVFDLEVKVFLILERGMELDDEGAILMTQVL